MYPKLVFIYVNAYMYSMREIVLFCSALADETRLRLLYLLKNGEICVCHLQDVLQTNQPKVSRHLAYLRKSGLVETRRDGKWTYYRLKRSGKGLGGILSQTFVEIADYPQIKKDARRLKQIFCKC
jgi:ArsR family transcriptional regulator